MFIQAMEVHFAQEELVLVVSACQTDYEAPPPGSFVLPLPTYVRR